MIIFLGEGMRGISLNCSVFVRWLRWSGLMLWMVVVMGGCRCVQRSDVVNDVVKDEGVIRIATIAMDNCGVNSALFEVVKQNDSVDVWLFQELSLGREQLAVRGSEGVEDGRGMWEGIRGGYDYRVVLLLNEMGEGEVEGIGVVSRFAVKEVGVIGLPSWRKKRCALVLDLDLPNGGLVVVNTDHDAYPTWWNCGRRNRQAEVLFDVIEKKCKGNAVVLGGDFNTIGDFYLPGRWRSDAEAERVERLANEAGMDEVGARGMMVTHQSVWGAFQLDHMFVSKEGVSCVKYGVVDFAGLTKHRAIWCDVRLRKGNAE